MISGIRFPPSYSGAIRQRWFRSFSVIPTCTPDRYERADRDFAVYAETQYVAIQLRAHLLASGHSSGAQLQPNTRNA